MADITQRLPIELLVEILGHASIPDVLRLEQVNHVFRDAILASPLIQHKMDLFAAGFEYNTTSGISLADSRKAFLQYRSNLDALRPNEERLLDHLRPGHGHDATTVGGVYATILRDSVRLVTLGSASRGIPYKEWEIPLPVESLAGYSFYPAADAIAFVDLSEPRAEIHLRTLSEGEQHPTAQSPVIYCPQDDLHPGYFATVLLTGSRLLLLAKTRSTWRFFIFDWKNAQVLFEFDQQSQSTAEFIDDCRLLLSVGPTSNAPPSIVLIDTEKLMGGVPVQTTFKLSPYFGEFGHPQLLTEQGAHSPAPAELLAPFHQDPAQRIVALVRITSPRYLVFRAKALLDFLESREGSEIRWDEWKSCVIIPLIDPYDPERIDIWVSGCRLFYLDYTGSGPGSRMKVYDFSLRGRSEYLSNEADEGLGVEKRLSSTGVVRHVPWGADELYDVCNGHDSVVFSQYFDNSTDSDDDDDDDRPEYNLKVQIWAF